MTKDSFGGSLKRERELRGVTLDEISAATRIATRFLQAIENEQWEQLPGGVFNRGFVRAVARYLGLDEESIVAEYTLAVGDRQSVPVWTGSPPAVTAELPWRAWIVVAIVVLVLLAGGWFGTKRFLAWRAAKRAAQAVTAQSGAPSDPAVAPAETASPPAPPSGAASAPNVSDVNTGAPSLASNAAPASAPAPAETQTLLLKIEASKKTKVTVLADATRVFSGTIKVGDTHTFSAKDRFELSANDAGSLLLEMNGKPLAPIGPAGRARKVTLTRDALKTASGGEN
jgi:cytoskeleton protein RodZ